MIKYIVALLLLLPFQCSAGQGMCPVPMVYVTTGGGSCDTIVASLTTGGTFAEIFSLNQFGNTFSASASDVICGIEFEVYALPNSPRTITLRVGTSADLSSSYVSGTLEITTEDVGTWVHVPLSSTITGSTTYYFAVENYGEGYAGRYSLVAASSSGSYEAYDGGWVLSLASGNPGIHFRVMK